MKTSIYLSLALLAAVTAWMLSGAFARAPQSQGDVSAETTTTPMKVLVADLEAGQITREVVVQGEIEPVRRVQVRAETDGQVVELPVTKGSLVQDGTMLVALAQEDRLAHLAKAAASVASQKVEVEGARKLQRQGLQSENRVRAAEAALAAAEAEHERAKLDLQRTRITAPFDGIMETRAVEHGSLVERGDVVAEIVDHSTLKAVGQIPQQSVSMIAHGQHVKVRLLDGNRADGRITYIARVAEPGTRSFRVEAEIANPGGELNAGVSAELRIAVARETAHFLSPAVLTLDDSGQVGVKAVGEESRVVFYPISLLRTGADGVWVSGLPSKVRVITQGQGFVAPTESVQAVTEG